MGGTEKERNLSGRHSAAPRVNTVLSTPECRELDSGLQGLPSPVPSLWPILLVCLQGMSLSHRPSGSGAPRASRSWVGMGM